MNVKNRTEASEAGFPTHFGGSIQRPLVPLCPGGGGGGEVNYLCGGSCWFDGLRGPRAASRPESAPPTVGEGDNIRKRVVMMIIFITLIGFNLCIVKVNLGTNLIKSQMHTYL